MATRHLLLLFCLLGIGLFGCPGEDKNDGGVDVGPVDTGMRRDTGNIDTGSGMDVGMVDTGAVDTGPDSGLPPDTGPDSGLPPDSGPDAGTPDTGPAGPGALLRIFDLSGEAMVGATVTVGGNTFTVGLDGTVFVPNLSGNTIFEVSQNGFTTTPFAFDIPANTRVVIDTNVQPEGTTTMLDDAVATMFNVDGLLGQIEVDTVETTAGVDVTGMFQLRAQNLDLTDPIEQLTSPQPFIGVDMNGMATELTALGVFDVQLTQGGTPLQIKSGSMAGVAIPIPQSFAPLVTANQMVSAWSYDDTTGRWIEEGTGQVFEMGFGNFTWIGQVPHFSWWMVGLPFSSACLDTNVDDGAAPVEGALVRAIGVDYGYVAAGFTDASGDVCLPLRPANDAVVSAIHESSSTIEAPVQVTAGGAPAACGGGSCTQTSLSLEAPACASGLVLDGTGAPYPNVVVLNRHFNGSGQLIATNTRTDGAGMYCVLGPPDEDVGVRAVDATSMDGDNVSMPADPAMCGSNCAVVRDLLLGDVAGCVHGTAINYRGPNMAPVQAAPGTPVLIYSDPPSVTVDCTPGNDDPASWGNLIGQTTIGANGTFCASGVPLGPAQVLIGDCDDWTSATCGPVISGVNPQMNAVCGQASCIDMGELRYETVCGG